MSTVEAVPARYVVLDQLGVGGMGAVYSAWDRELERRVALKVLHAGLDRDRFVREAQLLAKLKHPNVVTVYDVSRDGETAPFMTMELVEGVSLRRWLADGPRGVREVLATFRSVGAGLAAAHRAGLVHRDVKPENVLVGADGVARVADFGVALPVGEANKSPVPELSMTSSSSQRLTRPGALIGTPRYMAPEQRHGREPDPRADQYSFAVAMWEALFGEHPVSREAAGKPARGKVPAHVRRALQVALEKDPARRHPSMNALLDELSGERRARRTGWIVGLALVAASAAAIVGVHRGRSAEPPCAGGERRLAGMWDDAVRERVEKAFAATGRPYARDTYLRTAKLLDGYARSFVAMHRDACEATALRKEQSPALLDLRMECLDRRARALGALTATLAQPGDAVVLDNAVAAAARLEPIADCADLAALASAAALPEDAGMRLRIAALRARLDEVRALSATGKTKEAARLAAPLAEDARATGYAPLVAEALEELARTQWLGDARQQEATYGEAVDAAGRAADDRLLARMLVQLAATVGAALGRPGEGLGMLRAAEALLLEGGGDPALRVRIDAARGKILVTNARGEEAVPVLERAVAGAEKAFPPDSEILASALVSLGNAERSRGRLGAARACFERARGIYERVLGPDHPWVSGVMMNLGNLAHDEKDLAEALRLHRAVAAAMEARLGPEHADVARALTNLGTVLLEVGELDEARAVLERSLALKRKLLPAGHLNIASSLVALGELRRRQGDLAGALELLEEGRAIREKNGQAGAPLMAETLDDIAAVHADAGRCKEALAATQAAEKIEVEKGIAPHPHRAEVGPAGACVLSAAPPPAARSGRAR